MVTPGVGTMDQSEVISFIKDKPAGVLALVDGDKPYAVPLEHHFDGKTLSFITSARKGRKTNCIENNPNACYVIYESRREKTHQATPCRSVIIEGRVSLHGTTLKMDITKIGNWKCPPAMFATCNAG
jgi:nitroimidazol reductase NimA-like FMN-containing flavoprotein (pyridoxamine 5'-phosphate oxidase superfamily)